MTDTLYFVCAQATWPVWSHNPGFCDQFNHMIDFLIQFQQIPKKGVHHPLFQAIPLLTHDQVIHAHFADHGQLTQNIQGGDFAAVFPS